MRSPYFTGCPYFAGLLFTGFTVVRMCRMRIDVLMRLLCCYFHPAPHNTEKRNLSAIYTELSIILSVYTVSYEKKRSGGGGGVNIYKASSVQ
jgi:hypothetical protein